MVPSRIPGSLLRPSGRWRLAPTGGAPTRGTPTCGAPTGGAGERERSAQNRHDQRPGVLVGAASVCDGQCEHLRPLALGKPTPDAVRLVHLQGVGPAGHHGRALEAHRFCLRLAPRPRRSAFTFGVEEVRAGHSTARRMQLPIPQVGIRSGQAPGISHVDPLCRRHGGRDDRPATISTSDLRDGLHGRAEQCCRGRAVTGLVHVVPTTPGIGTRSVSRVAFQARGDGLMTASAPVELPRSGRIRADPGVVDLQTVEPVGVADKTWIMDLVDLDRGVIGRPRRAGQFTDRVCGAPAGREATRRWSQPRSRLFVRKPLLSAVTGSSVTRSPSFPPLGGPYRRLTGAQGFSIRAGVAVQLPSTPSAGGVT